MYIILKCKKLVKKQYQNHVLYLFWMSYSHPRNSLVTTTASNTLVLNVHYGDKRIFLNPQTRSKNSGHKQPRWAAAASQLWGFQTWGLGKPSLATTRTWERALPGSHCQPRSWNKMRRPSQEEGTLEGSHVRLGQRHPVTDWPPSLQGGRSVRSTGDRKRTRETEAFGWKDAAVDHSKSWTVPITPSTVLERHALYRWAVSVHQLMLGNHTHNS